MEKFLYFIGIDISKATLDFAVVLANKVLFHFQSSNDKDGIESFVKHLKTSCPESNLQNSLYCMEHTGIYNNHLLNYLNSKKANVWVEHPVNIKESLGMIRGKNDKVDAKRIAFYAYKNRGQTSSYTINYKTFGESIFNKYATLDLLTNLLRIIAYFDMFSKNKNPVNH